MSRRPEDLTYNDRRAIALASASGGARSLSGKFRWTARGQSVAHMTIRRLLDRGLMARVDDSTVELTGAGHEMAETMDVESYVVARQIVPSDDVVGYRGGRDDEDGTFREAPSAMGTDGLPMPVDVYMRRFS